MAGFFPIMEEAEIDFFNKHLDNCDIYLEYGAGGSTFLACENKNVQEVHSIEHDKDWIERTTHVVNYDLDKHSSSKLHFYHAELESSVDWGHDTSNIAKDKKEYYQSYIENIDRNIDLILIDGRFRISCALHSIQWCFHHCPDVKILFHDYGPRPGETLDWRPEYRIIEGFLDVQESVDTMYSFTIKDGLKWSYDYLDFCLKTYRNVST